MITNTGKNILAKYLIGQVPSYASYIAIGCGAKPLSTTAGDAFGDYSSQKSLEFETARVPIISRGYVTDGLVPEIVFSAEMPSENRYEITEVGLFSAAANPAALAYDSRVLYSFSDTENWEYHNEVGATDIQYIDVNGGDGTDSIDDHGLVVFQTNTDNLIFDNAGRVSRNERCRFLNNMIMLRGDLCTITEQTDVNLNTYLLPDINSSHVHITGSTIGLEKNSPSDEIRLAFSVVDKVTGSDDPSSVRIVLEFTSDDAPTTGEKSATLEIELNSGDLSSNRYFVAKKQLQELRRGTGFSWSSVSIVKVYVSILDSLGLVSDQHYVALDGLRIENTATISPVYGLTGYSVLKTTNGSPAVKAANTANMIEFRFAMDVQ